MRLTGILRERLFSPAQHGRNDRLILELTADTLRRKGCRVELIAEAQVGEVRIDAPAVFSMCQGPRATQELLKLERRGTLIVNSPRAVQRCYRVALSRMRGRHSGILAPMTVIPTSAPPAFQIEPGRTCWIKRGDVHATQAGDVVRVHSSDQYHEVLADFQRRGVEQAVVQPHLEGTVVKFYGVVGTTFFRFYSERDRKVAPLTFRRAHAAIERLVNEMGLLVYGGDAVLSRDGIQVIDVNDWPSFAYFRDEAAAAIGERIFQEAVMHVGNRMAGRPRRRAR